MISLIDNHSGRQKMTIAATRRTEKMDITVRVSWLENLRNEIFKGYYARVQRRPKRTEQMGLQFKYRADNVFIEL